MARKSKQMFSDRIRFNWGFHDAAADYGRGMPRLTHCAKQDLRHVSESFDKAYHAGYVSGLDFSKQGLPTETSEQAWKQQS